MLPSWHGGEFVCIVVAMTHDEKLDRARALIHEAVESADNTGRAARLACRAGTLAAHVYCRATDEGTRARARSLADEADGLEQRFTA